MYIYIYIYICIYIRNKTFVSKRVIVFKDLEETEIYLSLKCLIFDIYILTFYIIDIYNLHKYKNIYTVYEYL